MGYREFDRHNVSASFYRSAGGIFLCLLIFFCLSCSSLIAELEKQDNPDNPAVSYPIVYNVNGGSWRADYTAPKAYTSDWPVTLPVAADIDRPGYSFFGWYDNESLSGTVISGWKSGKKSSPVTLWAKWLSKNIIPAADAPSAIAGLTENGSPHAVVLTGELTESILIALHIALKIADSSGAKIALDMSTCTGLESFPPYVFASSGESLMSVTLPAIITVIGTNAFEKCPGLTSMAIPDGVTHIGTGAFNGCTGLASVTIPNSVTDIGDSAFRECTSLTSVALPKSVTDIGGSVFEGCSSLTDISVDKNNTVYTAFNGVLFTKNGETLVCYPAGKTDPSYSIPNTVKKIGYAAFHSCCCLGSVTVPGSVTGIGKSAFEGCSGLKSVTIPNGVTVIKSLAFSGCSGLETVKIPDTVTVIKRSLFEGCSGLKSVTIPNGVTEIGDSAFRECSSLTSVTIPGSVTSLGREVFRDCANLKSLVFANASGWFMTASYCEWESKTGGKPVNVSGLSENAAVFPASYYELYWYNRKNNPDNGHQGADDPSMHKAEEDSRIRVRSVILRAVQDRSVF